MGGGGEECGEREKSCYAHTLATRLKARNNLQVLLFLFCVPQSLHVYPDTHVKGIMLP